MKKKLYSLALAVALSLSAAVLVVGATALAAAPDVPWQSVQISAEAEDGPSYAAKILAECIPEAEVAALDYIDQVPVEGEQAAELCVSWTAHEQQNDCIRRAMIDLAGVDNVVVIVE